MVRGAAARTGSRLTATRSRPGISGEDGRAQRGELVRRELVDRDRRGGGGLAPAPERRDQHHRGRAQRPRGHAVRAQQQRVEADQVHVGHRRVGRRPERPADRRLAAGGPGADHAHELRDDAAEAHDHGAGGEEGEERHTYQLSTGRRRRRSPDSVRPVTHRSRPGALIRSRSMHGLTLFDTELGRCAIAWGPAGSSRSSCPGATTRPRAAASSAPAPARSTRRRRRTSPRRSTGSAGCSRASPTTSSASCST